MRHRYFIDTCGPLFQRMHEVVTERRAASGVLMAFAKEIGASAMYGDSPATYRFDFPRDADANPDTWCKTKPRRGVYYYRPRRNSPSGKAMAERIKLLPACPQVDAALDVVPNLPAGFPVVIEGGMGYSPFIRFNSLRDPAVVVVAVPWRDVDPAELAAYVKQAESKKRHTWCASMDFAQWTPPDWLREVKEWEVERLIAEGVMP